MRVLVMTAHPDDADMHAGGTVARWVDEGHDVRYVLFTSGDKGTDDPSTTPDRVIALRSAEQRTAAALLGVQHLTFLDYEDGDLAFRGPELAATATRLIRAEQPDLVLTHDPFMGSPRYANYQLHPDHRAVGHAVLDAVYFRAPGPLYHSEQITGGLRTHRVGELWLIMGDHADHAVDIGGTVDRKIAAVRAHVSQWGQHPDLEGFIRRRAEAVGAAHGLPLAEAFKRLRPS